MKLVRFLVAVSPAVASAVLCYLLFVAPAHSATFDFTPLVPWVNGLIQAFADAALAAVPVVSWFIVNWLRAHTRLKNEQALEILRKDLNALGDRIVTYNADKLRGLVPDALRNDVPAPNAQVATLANYFIVQLPNIAKKLGIDVNSKEGQEEIIRLLTAKLSAPAPASVTVGDVTVDNRPIPDPPKGENQ